MEEDLLEDKENHPNSHSKILELYLYPNLIMIYLKKIGANIAVPDLALILLKDLGALELFVLFIILTGNKKKHLNLIIIKNYPKSLFHLMLTRLN